MKRSEHVNRAKIAVINPATEEVIASIARTTPRQADVMIDLAAKAQREWAAIRPTGRAAILWETSRQISNCASELASLITAEVGKPIRDALEDVRIASEYFRYYAGAADKLEGESIPVGREYLDVNVLEPLGVTAHIVPWNYPTSLTARSVAPALAAGNAAVIKPSETAPLAIRLMVERISPAFPHGLIQVATGSGRDIGPYLVEHSGIHGITFTGSVPAGREVAASAGRNLKPIVTELGGKSPMIVFRDADLDRVVSDVSRAVFANAGQICSASSRLLVDEGVRKELVHDIAERARSLTVGPGQLDPDLGPLASLEQFRRVLAHITNAREEGATLVEGGARPKEFEKGYFLRPTLFDDVRPLMRVAQEEIFGPVLATIPFRNEREAVEIANGVRYGLVAAVYTSNLDRALRVAQALEAGQVWINDWFVGGAQAPTGGYKDSGLGREKGLRALQNYVRVKNLGIRISAT